MGLLFQAAIGILSVLVIVLSAEIVVEKMRGVASYYGVSEVVIAMTIISIGTSLPEIALHTVGSFNILADPSLMNEVSGTVLGMNIGSDVIQQTLIMGSVVFLASFMAGKDRMNFTHKFLKRDYFPMIGAHALVLIFALNRGLSRIEGLFLVATFAGYMYYLYRNKDEKLLRAGEASPSKRPRKDLLMGFAGMITLIYFSDTFLNVIESLIASTGLSGSMIGVVTIGFVSAMPEFVTALSGLRKNAEGISLGTLIGSNITNPLLGIGIGAAISTYRVPEPLVLWDLPMQIATALILVTYLWNKEVIGKILGESVRTLGLDKQANKLEEMDNGVLTFVGGLALVGLYIFYIGVRVIFFSVDFV